MAGPRRACGWNWWQVSGGERRRITAAVTNADGRTDAPLIERGALQRGTYELTFFVAEYFADFGAAADPPFLDVVTLRFTVGRAGRPLPRAAGDDAVVVQHLPGQLAPHAAARICAPRRRH